MKTIWQAFWKTVPPLATGGFLVLLILGCSNTEYSEGFSREKFEAVELGSSPAQLFAQIGEPLVVYAYPIPRKYSKPLKLEPAEWRIENQKYRSMELDLHYSRQIDGERDYQSCIIFLREGKVYRKVWDQVGD